MKLKCSGDACASLNEVEASLVCQYYLSLAHFISAGILAVLNKPVLRFSAFEAGMYCRSLALARRSSVSLMSAALARIEVCLFGSFAGCAHLYLDMLEMDKESLKLQVLDCLVMLCEDSEVQVNTLRFRLTLEECSVLVLKRVIMAGTMAHDRNVYCKARRSPPAIQLQRGAPGKLQSPASRCIFQACFRDWGGLRNVALAVCGLAHLPPYMCRRGNRQPFSRY